jgi:hypothetical protein
MDIEEQPRIEWYAERAAAHGQLAIEMMQHLAIYTVKAAEYGTSAAVSEAREAAHYAGLVIYAREDF